MIDERVWAEIDLAALTHNARLIQERLGSVAHMAVIKADAYGHGGVQVARALQACGVSYLGVACLSEALELRHADITLPILILGYTPVSKLSYLIHQDITQTVYDLSYAQELNEQATSLGYTLNIHIKVDTGMNRLGVRTADEVRAIVGLPHLRLEGLFTHLSSADTPEYQPVRDQLALFNEIQAALGDIKIPITHCANSGGVLYYKESWYSMVRSGLLLMGATGLPDFRPVMHLKARIAQVKLVQAGECISYDRTYTAPCDMKVAVVCVGYADGYMRALSNTAQAVCKGKRVNVVGRVCMDMLMLDVSEVAEVAMGDTVTLFGAEGLSASELAQKAGTIPYEILCAVSRRVPRIYLNYQDDIPHKDGEFVKLWSPRPRVYQE